VLAGTQSGKTVYGPWWLLREIMHRGPGDYLFATPTYPLLEVKALPSFRFLFQTILKLGTYKTAPVRAFTFNKNGEDLLRKNGWKITEPTRIVFGHASSPESLESATYKAAVLDEAGQKQFKVDSKQAIDRRLSIHRGRMLITTTPYHIGWLKLDIYDKAANRKGSEKDIEVIQFESIMNPTFPVDEYERAQRLLPPWKFNLFYRAMWERPIGQIYSSFDEERDVVDPFPIPENWLRFLGMDFGGVNTAGVYFAVDPDYKQMVVYREYHAGDKSAAEHTKDLLKGEAIIPTCFGGAASEKQWRVEFTNSGLPISRPPIGDVEVGINRVFAMHVEGRIKVFRNCLKYIDEKLRYSRKLNDMDEPTEDIEDKATFHLMDAERYIIAHLWTGAGDLGGEVIGF